MNHKMNKNFKKYIIGVIILEVIYNVLVLAIPFSHKSEVSFWLLWFVGFLSILVQPFIARYGLNNSNTYKSKIFGWPIIRLGYLYLLIQMGFCVALFTLGSFFRVDYWIILIVEVILIGLIAIGLITVDSYKEEITKIEDSVPLATKFISELKIDSEILLKKMTEESIRIKLEEFVEEVKYSDPVSNDSLIEIEEEINMNYQALKNNLEAGIIETVFSDIDELIILVKERNQKAKASKKK